METVIVIAAIFLILMGTYGVAPLLKANGPRMREAAPRFVANDPITVAIQREVEARPAPVRTAAARPQVLPNFRVDQGDPYAEVSMLRAQIEHLRSEIVALSSTSSTSSERSERTTTRRSRTGQYNDLPRPLRRQVKEIRSIRRPMRI